MTASSATAERRKNIENIYPLAPMQEGFLFHAVLAPEAGLYMPQIVVHLTGEIDAGALQAAWRQAVQRHSVLRSGFYWEERDEPFQVVYREAPLNWTSLDWSDADDSGRAERLSELLAANRTDSFDLRRPPLLRLHWIDCGNGQYSLVVCHHHLILDGWSAGQLISEAFQLYLRKTGALLPPLPTRRPYAEYIAWLKRQDRNAAQSFWRDYLAGCVPTSFLPATTGASGFARREWTCPASITKAAKSLTQRLGITLNTLLQGALGLLIARQIGSLDVMFGATSSGRPATLDRATEMIGLFINTLPVRVKIDPAQSLGSWLIALQTNHARTDRHSHLPLREIQGERGALFDCLMIFESYPVSTDLGASAAFKLTGVEFDERTHYPLTLMAAADGAGLKLTALYACDALDETAIDAELAAFGKLLEEIVSSPEQTVQRVLGDTKARQRPASEAAADRKPNGAVAPGVDAPAADNIAPSTETEKMLAAAWAEVLKRPEPAANAHFFELGGHSLLAARVISRVRRELGMEIPVRSLFDRPVLADLAAYIDALRIAGPRAEPGHREIEI